MRHSSPVCSEDPDWFISDDPVHTEVDELLEPCVPQMLTDPHVHGQGSPTRFLHEISIDHGVVRMHDRVAVLHHLIQ